MRDPTLKIFILSIFLSFTSCSTTEIISGKLYYSGNEPFKEISLELSDGTGIKICNNSLLTDSLETNINKQITIEVNYHNEHDQDCYEVIKIIK